MGTEQAKFVEADYSVPHTQFNRTADGFTVTYKNTPLWFYKIVHMDMSHAKGLGALFALLFVYLPGLIIGGIIFAIFGRTTIVVTADTITIDKKILRRADFAHFSVNQTYKSPKDENTVAVLGYSYGSRSFPFGGIFKDGDAHEVASALNRHLRLTPEAGDELQTSPEALRAARPTDF